MIATRNPETVTNTHIRSAARKTARIFQRARQSMPHIAWQVAEPPPVDAPGQDCPDHGPHADSDCDKC